MKAVLKKYFNHIDGLNGILLILYLSIVFFVSFFTKDLAISLNINNDRELFNAATVVVRSFVFSFSLALAISPLLLNLIKKASLNLNNSIKKANYNNKYSKILIILLPFVVFLFNYIVFYPGAFSPDSIDQYEQSITNTYCDWHPVLHTLLTFKLPLLLTSNWIGSIALFQVIAFSLIISYSTYSVYKYIGNYAALLYLAFVMLNPNIVNLSITPWKDAAFSICALLCSVFAMNIVYTNGNWLKHIPNMISLSVVLTVTTMVRHNALLFTVPLIFALLFWKFGKRMVIVCLIAILLIVGIKIPVYSAVEVREKKQGIVEMVGLPMNVIAAVAAEDYEVLDDETKEFVLSIAPEKIWKEHYRYGTFNNIKWDSSFNESPINEYGAKRILKLAVKCFIKSPFISTLAVVKLTEQVYSVFSDYNSFLKPAVIGNKFGIELKGFPLFQKFNLLYTMFANAVLPHLFMYTGVMLLLIIVSVLIKCRFNKLKDWKKALFAFPVLIYNFGTMFLLTGAEDSTRFFCYTFLVGPIIYFILIINEKDRKTL